MLNHLYTPYLTLNWPFSFRYRKCKKKKKLIVKENLEGLNSYKYEESGRWLVKGPPSHGLKRVRKKVNFLLQVIGHLLVGKEYN